ncbi:MAG: HD domain-containing protein [Planctomycetes bacterium]|nr:HD domain-containing protein [Planctomycetota bacterium]
MAGRATAEGSVASAEPVQGQRFFPVALDSIDNRALDMDLYLKSDGRATPVLYRSTGVEFAVEDRSRLMQQGVKFLYVPLTQHKAYQRALTQRLDTLFKDAAQSRAERGRVIRAACTKMIEDVLLLPGQPHAIESVKAISAQFVDWSAGDSTQFSHLLDMTSHDFYTATHMVNVGVGCGLLIGELRPGDTELHAVVIQGGLLHDVGKRLVPEEILNKEGKLEPSEWAVLKKHPLDGFKELSAQDDMPEVVLEMTRDHHERLDGTGYPNRLKDEQIGFAARVCAVIDVFDAISSSRPYRGPTPPIDTLKIMREGIGTHFDPDILDRWCEIVERMISEDPERAVPSTGEPAALSYESLQPHGLPPKATAAYQPRPNLWQDNRRQHQRYDCALKVKVTFVRQGKPYPVKIGECTEFDTIDFGAGGLQLRTPWPLTLNDILTIEIRAKGGEIITRRACVVRVRSAQRRGWVAGLRFMADDATF